MAPGSVTTLEPVGLRQATGDIIVTPVSAVTECNSFLACDHAGYVLLVIKCNSCLRVIKLEIFACDQMRLHACA